MATTHQDGGRYALVAPLVVLRADGPMLISGRQHDPAFRPAAGSGRGWE